MNEQPADKASVLAGLKVVDFGQYVAGPLVAQTLADFGADVVRIDPPGGPVWKSDGNALLQRGKRSIVLDLKNPDDLAIAKKLVDRADILIENFRPGVMDRLGLGWADAEKRNPRLIYCSIPGFKSDDPRASIYATEGVVASAAGLYPSQDFDPDGEPVVNTLHLASVIAAMVATHTIIAALIARERCGRGQRSEVSMYEAAFELLRFYTDKPPQEERRRIQLGSARPIAIAKSYECADGRSVRVSWLEKRQLETFARFVGKYDEWKAKGLLDLGVTRAVSDMAASNLLAQEAAAIFITKPAEYWEREVGAASDLIIVRTTEEFLIYDEQARAVDASVRRIDPEFGVTYQGGVSFNLTKTPGNPGTRHELDADRASILAELDSPAPVHPPVSQPIRIQAALEGFKALDMTVLLAGPGLGRVLGEYGAEVIHVGRPNWNGMRFHYQVHIGKKSMLLDLKQAESRRVFDRLLEDADIISTNFSQSVARRLGVDYETVAAKRPEIVYSRISAHGAWGPREEFRGHEEVGQAATGILVRFSGDRTGNMEFFALNDSGTGHVAATGILLSLYHKLKTGDGQFVGSSLAQTSVMWQMPYLIAHANYDWRKDPGGLDFRGYGPLDRLYKAADGRWIYLSAAGTDGLAELASVPGLEGIDTLDSAQIGIEGGDAVDADALQNDLAKRFATQPAQVWADRLKTLRKAGASLVATVDEPMDDPWARAQGLASEVDFPGAGIGLQVGPAPRLSLTPMKLGVPVGPPGSDTERVLRDIGLGDETEQLVAAGTVSLEMGEVAAH